jgi:anaerobic ribonucleoside-triphosphate reductase
MTTVKKVPCEVYSRIVGYYRPTQNWAAHKQQEFKDRQTYDPRAAVEEAKRCG